MFNDITLPYSHVESIYNMHAQCLNTNHKRVQEHKNEWLVVHVGHVVEAIIIHRWSSTMTDECDNFLLNKLSEHVVWKMRGTLKRYT